MDTLQELMTHTEATSPYSHVFISHANPEDNYFASWLATKLNLLGYSVWCDTKELRGGEDFWKNIEHEIRAKAIFFVFVVSQHSITKNGTLNELAVASKIKDRSDFVIPVRLDSTPFDQFPSEIIRLTAIDFSSNWASGFRKLITKIEGTTPRRESFEIDRITEWWNSSFSNSSNGIVDREESYWSNWVSCKLPSNLYLHRVLQSPKSHTSFKYPVVVEGNWLVSFASASDLAISPEYSTRYELDEFLKRKDFEIYTQKSIIHNASNKVIELLNLAFQSHLISKGLKHYRLAQGDAFYFAETIRDNVSTSRVKLDRYELNYVSLTGDSTDYKWHYAIQAQAILRPERAFWISHHIVFTENGLPVDHATQHRLRRKVGSGWYNKQWRDRLLAALLLLSGNPTDDFIEIAVADDQMAFVSAFPIKLSSSIGYIDPL